MTNPKGALRIASKGKTIIPWTQYTSAYDIRSRTLYAHTYDNHDVYEMNFGDASEWGRTRYFDFIRPRAYKSFVEER